MQIRLCPCYKKKMPRIDIAGLPSLIQFLGILFWISIPLLKNVCILKKEVCFQSRVIMMRKLPSLMLC